MYVKWGATQDEYGADLLAMLLPAGNTQDSWYCVKVVDLFSASLFCNSQSVLNGCGQRHILFLSRCRLRMNSFPLPLGKGFYREPDFSQLAVNDIFGHFLLHQH
jgi:hypothetical protein